MAFKRITFHQAAWDRMVGDPKIQSDVTARAERVADQARSNAASTADIRVESGPTRDSRRPRAAIIAFDWPNNRDRTFQSLLSAIDAGR